MTRMIVEKPTAGFSTGAHLQALVDELVRFVKGNPTLAEAAMSAKTAVSTVQADGTSAAGPTSLTSALSDFVTDVVAVGDYVTILKSDEEANIGCWRVTAVVDLNELTLDAALVSDTAMSFTVDRGRYFRHSLNDMNVHFIL